MLRLKQKAGVIIYHFNNDFSGSPVALRNKIFKDGITDYVIITFSKGGVLDDLRILPIVSVKFDRLLWPPIKLVVFWMYSLVISLVNFRKLHDFNTIQSLPIIFFVNKLLGPNERFRVFLHEFYVNNKALNKFLIFCLKNTETRYVFVSDYQRIYYEDNYNIKGSTSPNYLNPIFYELSKTKKYNKYNERSRITFVGSSKVYKGMQTFLELCKNNKLPKNIVPTLVSSDLPEVYQNSVIEIHVRPEEKKLAQIYSESLFVLNLSIEHLWVETFGMTIFEACCFGAIPITPKLGGFSDYLDPDCYLSLDTSQSTNRQVEQLEQLILDNISSFDWERLHNRLLCHSKSSEKLSKILES